MFSGIVEGTGTVVARETSDRGAATRLRIDAGEIAVGVKAGDSIAINGVCLTAVNAAADQRTLDFDVIGETLACTNLGELAVGSTVNLERSLRADARVDGHFVQGHVDGVGEVVARTDGPTETRLSVRAPEVVAAVCVRKGSIAIDGVSLTIADFDDTARTVTVALIPTTLARTNLASRRIGDRVNLEGDILGKYVVAYLSRMGRLPSAPLSPDQIHEAGF